MATTESRTKSWKSELNGTYRHVDGTVTKLYGSTLTQDLVSISKGDNIPDFRRKIANGLSATTSLEGVNCFVDRRPGTVLIYGNGLSAGLAVNVYGKTHNGQFPPSAVNGALVSKATTEAQIAFAKKTRQKTQSFAGGVFAGELLETVRLLASPTKRLRKEVGDLLDKARKGKAKKLSSKAMRSLVADTWLEWSFGVKPLINDANDAANAFERLATGRNFDLIRVTATGMSEEYTKRANQTLPFGALLGVPGTLQCGLAWHDRCEATYRGVIKSQNPSGDMPLPMQFGLDVSSILPTAWELIPWSFFVDYFTNVGNVIDAWSIRFVDFSWLNRTVRNSRSAKTEGLYYNGGAGLSGSVSGIQVSGRRTTISRGVASNQFTPSLTLQIPGFPSTKWINLAALANGIADLKRR